MRKQFSKMAPSEQEAFRLGQEIVIDEVLAYIADLESSRNSESSYGKGQLFILRELVKEICK